MKKAMMMGVIAAALAAGSAQAAAIAWQTGNIGSIAVNGGSNFASDWAGQTMTFYTVAAGFDYSGFLADLAAGNDVSGYAVTVSATASIAGASKYNTQITSPDLYTASTTYYGFAIAQNANADMNAAGTVDYLVSALWTGTVAANLTANLGPLGFTTLDVVPEPTSMALLALGVAALGLRRRLRK
jgi:hypothetical protein